MVIIYIYLQGSGGILLITKALFGSKFQPYWLLALLASSKSQYVLIILDPQKIRLKE